MENPFGIKNSFRCSDTIKGIFNLLQSCTIEAPAQIDELTNIAGQKAVITYAKKAISNFKLRAGDPVGIKVTLRGNTMYEFLDRLISIATPRIRDFRGLSSKGFDNFGNYNFGITEQVVFPEIDYDKVNTIRGMNLTIVTTAESKEESHSLLKFFGFL